MRQMRTFTVKRAMHEHAAAYCMVLCRTYRLWLRWRVRVCLVSVIVFCSSP